jgi:hypothetical protein
MIRIYHNIIKFYIPMNNIFLMAVLNSFKNIIENFDFCIIIYLVFLNLNFLIIARINEIIYFHTYIFFLLRIVYFFKKLL